MLELCTLASGSSGNAILVFTETTRLLIDAGISAKKICEGLKNLNLSPADLTGICITHSHSDHVGGLRVFLKRTSAPVFATASTAQALDNIEGVAERIHTIFPSEPFVLGDLSVQPFSTSHDAPGSVGYTITHDTRKCCVVTDLGYVTEDVRRNVYGSHLALVEANHDVEWLMSGPYPYYLKQRILGDRGHLSNEDSAQLCCELVQHGTEKLILAHLSQENNTPERARSVVCSTLSRRGMGHIPVTVAPRCTCGIPVEV